MPHQPHSLDTIISGGQTGVDRAALDLGLHFRIAIAGWCPKGRLAEDGPIPERYPLKETPSSKFSQRTDWNVRDSDGTLVLTYDIPTGGTALTIRLAQRRHKPYLVLKLEQNAHPTTLPSWLEQHHIQRLNIAGPRESTYPGIYTSAYSFLDTVLLARKE
jgi:hypothetical protein